jgi:hypothetical protein
VWAELDLIVADEFRDGNVPAIKEPLRVARRAFQALPETVAEYRFRGEDSDAVKHCAQVQYFPEERPENEFRTPLKYIAIRIRKRQQELFADGASVKYFAVATNMWDWDVRRLLRWHREKAGTIEAVHDVLKNELAGGVMPCGRFGSNAAWFRFTVLTYNVLAGMNRLALPPELHEARPKRLRFVIFHTPGKLIHHARRVVLRLAQTLNRFTGWHRALGRLPLPVAG